MSLSKSQLNEGLVFSFIYSNDVLNETKRIFPKLNNMFSRMFWWSMGVTLFAGVGTLIGNTTKGDVSLASTLLITAALFLAVLVTLTLSVIFISQVKTFSTRGKYNQLIRDNWNHFYVWLDKLNIVPEYEDIVPDNWKHKGSEFFWLFQGDTSLNFHDMDGEFYVLTKLDGEPNRYVLVHITVEEITTVTNNSLTTRLETVVTRDFTPKHINVYTSNPPTPFTIDDNFFFINLDENTTETLVNMRELFLTLSECQLTEGDKAGVARVYAELEDVTKLIKPLIPLGVDEETITLYREAVTLLHGELVTIRNNYVDQLKTALTEQVELLNVLFATEAEQSTTPQHS